MDPTNHLMYLYSVLNLIFKTYIRSIQIVCIFPFSDTCYVCMDKTRNQQMYVYLVCIAEFNVILHALLKGCNLWM